MRIAHFDEVPEVAPARRGFRGGGIAFRDLLSGTEGTADNYGLQWVVVEDAFHTPRHRHTFEQVRILVEGCFGFGPGQQQEAGSVGYFCEGTYYTQDARGRSVTLLLQVGGPSGQGFMSRRQLYQGIEALSHCGRFEDGVFTWHDAQGTKHNQDSYEAAWEHIHGRAIRYAKPQYDGPVLLRPERFRYLAVPDASGVSMKRLGRFNDHGLEIAQLRLAAAARWQVPASSSTRLLVCASGEGAIDGQPFRRWTSIEVARHESPVMSAAQDAEFWWMDIPAYAADALAGAADAMPGRVAASGVSSSQPLGAVQSAPTAS